MRNFQANIASDVLLDLSGAGPLHARLIQALREAIRGGRLAGGSTLPPSRALADELGCSRWVVSQAYAQLAAEGYLAATAGSGTRVRDLNGGNPPGPVTGGVFASAGQAVPAVLMDLAPGLPDLRAFPLRRWLTAVRAGAASMGAADLGYPHPLGHPRLRQVLAEYLPRVRGAQAGPADLVVTAGATDAISLLCRTLKRHGHTAVAVEDPSWHQLRGVLAAAGLTAVPVPVDEQGMRADLLPAQAGVRAVIVSPAHQFPSGVVLSPPRRAALLDWASGCDGLIIEDDYDAAFRYDRRPVGALQGAARSSVALVGSVSKTLSPAVGLGWMTVPPTLMPLLRAAVVRPSGVPVLDQLAFAAFVETGSYHRHLRASRLRYRARRDRLVAELAGQLPDGGVTGAAAGLHLTLRLPQGTDAAAVVRRAAAAGVRVANLDTYRFASRPAEPGLVLGYGNLADHHVAGAVARLATAVRNGLPTVTKVILKWGKSSVWGNSVCTRVLWNDNNLGILAGRTMDWPESTEPVLTVAPRDYQRHGGKVGPLGVINENALEWKSRYGSIIVSVYGIGTVDGLNEKGLAANALYLKSTELPPRDPAKPGLQIGLWAQYLLDNAATVDEAISLMRGIQLVMVEAHGRQATIHLAVEDAGGDSAVMENIGGELVIHHGPQYRLMTNDPPYAEQLHLLDQQDFSKPSRDLPIPGNVNPVDRFQRAAYFRALLPEPRSAREAAAGILSVMRNVSVPFGAPYGEFGIYNTEYRTVADLTNLRYFFELSTSPNLLWAELGRFDLSGGQPVRVLDPDDIDLCGDVSGRFQPAEIGF